MNSFPDVKISAARLDVREFGPEDASLVRAVLVQDGALMALARWALTEGGMQRVWLTANTDNPASIRVAEKAGFLHEGTLRRAGAEEDGLHDLAVFSLLDNDY